MTESLLEYMQRHLKEYRAMKPEIVVKLQHMFPGCEKYVSCCDTHWNPKLENVEYVPVPKTIAYIVPGTTKAPEGFEDVKVNDL